MNDDQSVSAPSTPTQSGETRGRQIRLEPLPPGMWGVVLGVALGVLAPLGGFLIGSILGPGALGAPIAPMFLSLFVGIVIGALGILAAMFAGYRLVRHLRVARGSAEEATT